MDKEYEEYVQELDQLYRLRLMRGIIPNPEKFNNPKVKELAEKIYQAHLEMDKADNIIIDLHFHQ
jgi:nucleoside 2-deoxyribosyltransferase